jgi:RimJ/RimL family protein N-acetyltransferase
VHPVLETDRLVLRRFTTEDIDDIVALDADPEVMRYISGGLPTPRHEIETDFLPAWLSYYERYAGFGFWAAHEKATGEFIGQPCLAAGDGKSRTEIH